MMLRSSAFDILGRDTWVVARSMEAWSSMRSSTVSATPTRISVEGARWSESALMRLANCRTVSLSPT